MVTYLVRTPKIKNTLLTLHKVSFVGFIVSFVNITNPHIQGSLNPKFNSAQSDQIIDKLKSDNGINYILGITLIFVIDIISFI